MQLPGKAFSMSQAGARLLVATSSRHVLAYDIRRRAALLLHVILCSCIVLVPITLSNGAGWPPGCCASTSCNVQRCCMHG